VDSADARAGRLTKQQTKGFAACFALFSAGIFLITA